MAARRVVSPSLAPVLAPLVTTVALAVAATPVVPSGAAVVRPSPVAEPVTEPVTEPGSVLGWLARDGRELDDDWSDHDVVERLLLAVLEETPGSALRRLGVADRRLTALLPTDAGMRRTARGLGLPAATEEEVATALLQMDDAAADPAGAREATYLYLVVPGRRLRVADLRSLARQRGHVVTLLVDGRPATVRPRLVDGVLRLVDHDWPPRGAPRLVPGATDVLVGRRQVVQGVDRLPEAYDS